MSWEQRQKEAYELYLKDGVIGHFSHRSHKSAQLLGKVINDLIPGRTCLDIGCGLLETPYYIEMSPDVKWYGIDPYDDEIKRTFEFKVGKAENIPYDIDFDAVCFATSLDHVEDINATMKEVNRVLKPNGLVFLWTSIYKNETDYNEFHDITLTGRFITKLFSDYILYSSHKIYDREYIYVFKKK